MKIYCTKYALTDGVIIYDADIKEDTEMAVVRKGMGYPLYLHGEGRDWHRTEEAAKDRANAMRDRKLKSIEKQAARLKVMDFDDIKDLSGG